MVAENKLARIDPKFESYLKMLYPRESIREGTKKLNKMLEDMIYDPHKK